MRTTLEVDEGATVPDTCRDLRSSVATLDEAELVVRMLRLAREKTLGRGLVVPRLSTEEALVVLDLLEDLSKAIWAAHEPEFVKLLAHPPDEEVLDDPDGSDEVPLTSP